MKVYLLNQHNQNIGDYPANKIDLLINAPFSQEAEDEFDRLHRSRYRLRCECPRIMHVVQWSYPFLRRNPKQSKGDPECGLCESNGASNGRGTFAVSKESSGIDLILATRRHSRTPPPKKPPTKGSGHPSHKQKYQSAFTVLYTIMERCGFTSLSSALDWNDIWNRVHQQLQTAPLCHQSSRSLAAFAWMPGRIYEDGLRGLNRRMHNDWDHPKMKAEGWVFGILQDSPIGGEVKLHPLSTSMREALQARGSVVFSPYHFQVPRHNVAKVGRTGPYLVLALCSTNSEDDPHFAKPTFHRLILQSILDERHPLPIESRFEGEVAELLISRRISFHKPVFLDSERIRPDFILPQERIVIEVQGMNDDYYREHKRVVHQRIEMSETYRGFKLLTYNANDGETLKGFEEKLMASLGSRQSISGAPSYEVERAKTIHI